MMIFKNFIRYFIIFLITPLIHFEFLSTKQRLDAGTYNIYMYMYDLFFVIFLFFRPVKIE